MKRSITGFVKGKTLYPHTRDAASEEEEEEEEEEGAGEEEDGLSDDDDDDHHASNPRRRQRRVHLPPAATNNQDDGPADLYAELLSRPPQEHDVMVVDAKEKKKEEAVIEVIDDDGEDSDVQEVQDDDVIVMSVPRRRRRPRQRAAPQEEEAEEAAKSPPGFDCDVCGERITSMSKTAHETSTLHLFNAKKQSTSRRIMLPENNRGIQILARMGWTEDRGGLGREGQGRMQPAKSILKLDRKGLGHKQPQARVTHFPSHDAEQAIRAEDGLSQAERAHQEFEKMRVEERKKQRQVTRGSVTPSETAKERKDRMKEEKHRRDKIRRELHEDLPEGFEDYFDEKKKPNVKGAIDVNDDDDDIPDPL